jgi:Tfp pilus assembly protein PilV
LAAFTLIEVMIAGAILFTCLFAILALLSNSLRNARALQNTKSDPRSSIASQVYYELSHTNTIAETSGSGEFESYRYEYEVREIETNGLCEVDIALAGSSRVPVSAATMQMVMYLPQLQQKLGGGPARR